MIYGIECTAPYNASDSEHRLRHHTVKIDAAGDEVLPDAFSVILNKVGGEPLRRQLAQ